ncbi:MAG: polysaccharide biosynthesis/export family protein, partial [Armatimonadota bacterium]|nr:polysaccharide biosynthesis/export family protein [Armatimonadota bacterium]
MHHLRSRSQPGTSTPQRLSTHAASRRPRALLLSILAQVICLAPYAFPVSAEEAPRPGMRLNTRESTPAETPEETDAKAAERKKGTPEDRRTTLRRVELGLQRDSRQGTYRTIAREDYVLGAYDELEISLLGPRPEKWEVPVSPEGTVTLPHAGSIACAGLRLADAREVFVRALSRFYRNFELVVVVSRLRGIEVTVTGHVMAPGPQSVPALTRVWETIERAGGIAESGSVRAVRITRRDGKREVVDLYPFLFEGREENNPVLDGGDAVHLPIAERVVGLSGEVRRPGPARGSPGPAWPVRRPRP